MKKAPQLPRLRLPQLRDHQYQLLLIRIEPLQPTRLPLSSPKKLPTVTATDPTRSERPTTATTASTCNKTSRTPPISTVWHTRTRTIRKIATNILITRNEAKIRDIVDTVGAITTHGDVDLVITSLTLAIKVEATMHLALPTNGQTSTIQMAPTRITLEQVALTSQVTTILTLEAITITSIIVEVTIRATIRTYPMRRLTLVGTDMNTMIRVTQQPVEVKVQQAMSLSRSTIIRTLRRANRHREQARVKGQPLGRATTAIAIFSNMITIMVTMSMISLKATITWRIVAVITEAVTQNTVVEATVTKTGSHNNTGRLSRKIQTRSTRIRISTLQQEVVIKAPGQVKLQIRVTLLASKTWVTVTSIHRISLGTMLTMLTKIELRLTSKTSISQRTHLPPTSLLSKSPTILTNSSPNTNSKARIRPSTTINQSNPQVTPQTLLILPPLTVV